MAPSWLDEYHALVGGVGVVDLSSRTQIELTGADRVKFLQGMCSNDIARLAAGEGCEAFLPNAQGKILGHVLVFVDRDLIVLESSPGQSGIARLLDRYVIREQVELHDRSADWGELLVAGPAAQELVASLVSAPLPEKYLSHAACELAGQPVTIRRVAMTGPEGYLLAMGRSATPTVLAAIVQAGATAVGESAWQAARIEAGFPLYGIDITDANLPQEVGRDAVAISFRKGCYIGQETVARIDALGHVNRQLVGVQLPAGPLPTPGTPLTADDKPVGQITSATYSPHLQSPLALAYVRREHTTPGTELTAGASTATVVNLPLQQS